MLRSIRPTRATERVVSGGPVSAVAFPQADAGLPDTNFFNSAPRPRFRSRCGRGRVVTRRTSPTNLACGEAGRVRAPVTSPKPEQQSFRYLAPPA
jgi:hypothetical protein